MSLFQKFKSYKQSRNERKIEKNARTIKNKKAIKDDRAYALDYFRSLSDPEIAVPALMPRFDFSIEQSIIDTREKETAMAGIVKHGELAIPFILEHMKTTSLIAWPLKLLAELKLDDDIIKGKLIELLDFSDTSFDHAALDKNFDILCYLADYKLENMAGKLSHFLKDPDERVRFACVEVLIQQDDPEIKDMLEPFLADTTAENRRIRMKVVEAFVKNDWRVEDPKKFDAGLITEGVFVTKKGKVERRN